MAPITEDSVARPPVASGHCFGRRGSTELREPSRKRATDHAGADDSNPHVYSCYAMWPLDPLDTVVAFVPRRNRASCEARDALSPY